MAGTIRAGMAGWVFADWRGGQFYPEGLKQKEELHWASRQVTAIEINSTFYQNQKPASFEAWAAQTPDDFVFTVKGHQAVTHIKRLKDVEQPVAFFFNSVEALGKRLGAVCWQLPPNMKFDAERMETFLNLLPKTVRQAIEVRNLSFANPVFIAQLKAHNVALVAADTTLWPHLDQTADFAYCRLQGPQGGERYSPAQLDTWAARLRTWSEGGIPAGDPIIVPATKTKTPRDVFCYFVSADKPNAPRNALAIMERLGIAPAAG